MYFLGKAIISSISECFCKLKITSREKMYIMPTLQHKIGIGYLFIDIFVNHYDLFYHF